MAYSSQAGYLIKTLHLLLQRFKRKNDRVLHQIFEVDFLCSAASIARTWSTVTARDGSALSASKAFATSCCSQFPIARSRAIRTRSPSRIISLSVAYSPAATLVFLSRIYYRWPISAFAGNVMPLKI